MGEHPVQVQLVWFVSQPILAIGQHTRHWRCRSHQHYFQELLGYVALRFHTFDALRILIRNVIGSIVDGALAGKSPIPPKEKPALYFIANDLVGANNISIEDFSVWTESGGDVINQIANVYGKGDGVYGPNDGLKTLAPSATFTPYSSKYTITASPTGWVEPSKPTWAAGETGWGSKSYSDSPLDTI